MPLEQLGRSLMLLGVGIILLGGVLMLLGRIPFLNLGSLPGDLRIQRENFACFAPITTMLLLSVVLTIILNIAARLLNR